MILHNTILPDNLGSYYFCCDMAKCLCACCIEGDAGAPLDPEEISQLQDFIEPIKPFMTENGAKTITETGVFDYDDKGNYVTPLVNGAACAYCNFTNGIAVCAIELAYEQGVIAFQKPVSCHLYPIRINRLGSFDKITYHRWGICRPAIQKGGNKRISLLAFLKDALIRKYGESWYNELLSLSKV